MSAIRERTSLCVVELPKKLTSERNLLSHFSKFGEVKNVVVNKELRTGLIQFSNHFHAQSAKTQGCVYEGLPLNLFWSESALDPRSRNKQEYSVPDSGQMWQDDEKECFGVETIPTSTRIERKNTPSILIKEHLKLSDIRKKGSPINLSKASKPETVATIKSSLKAAKANSKLITRELKFGKKNLLTHEKKRKTLRKQILAAPSSTVESTSEEQESMSTSNSMYEQTDLQRKLSLLDERDKTIRKITVADSNIKTAVAIRGTCKDMCPERERLSRQCGHAIAFYEMIPGTNTMDENKAVKEYTRSSADQEVPLPHDLRPEPVLSMTMNYLITNIISRVDNPEENKALWYSFCWNRLRSIRKDIILQQLCDMKTVKIVEQCARFHISCYDHMCGADIGGFDDKINTQILIDCLQTLRHMYEDLAQHNISCPNEAEFYSYLILLKLTTGDIIWEYQQYSLDMQLSPQVQFAIETYMAFKNNMYAKYFNLVNKASYLTACLMQRYFDLVRTQAIKTMVKAYCLPGKAVGISSSFVVSSLKFDSHTHALRFCDNEGVRLRFDGIKDEINDDVSSSSFLIREKRLPIANAVIGEDNLLPVYIPHEVHSSFDEFGNLKNSLSTAESENEDNFSNTSEDMPYIKNEKSEVDLQEDVTDCAPSFKFSLSPTVKKEQFFDMNISSFKFIPSNKSILQNDLQDDNMIITNENVSKLHHEELDVEFKDSKLNYTAQNTSYSKLMPETLSSSLNETKIETPFSFSLGSPALKSNISFKCEEHEPMITEVPTTKPTNNDNLVSHFVSNSQTVNSFHQSLPNANSDFLNNRAIGYNEFSSSTTKHQPKVWIRTNIPLQCQDTAIQNVFGKQQESVIENNEIARLLDIEKSKALEYEMALRKAAEEKKRMEEERLLEIERMHRKIEEQKTLNSLRKYVGTRLKAINARKCARQWRRRIQQLKKTRADFPMLVQLPVNKHLKLWGAIDSIPVNSVYQRVRGQKKSTNVISQLLLSGVKDSCDYLGLSIAEELAKSAAKRMKKGVVRPVYWKLAISLPCSNNLNSELYVFNQLMRKWCKQAFYRNSNTCIGSVESLMTSLQIPVNISLSFIDNAQSTLSLDSLDAIVFVVLSKSENEKQCLQRLRTLISCQRKNSDFSVAVMNIGLCKLERVLKMELEELHEQNLIQHWSMNPWLSPNSIFDSLNFLTKHVNIASHISTTSLKLLVEQVTEDFFDSLSSGLHWSNGLREAMKHPNIVISLYNACLTKFKDLLLSRKLENYFSFGKEFQMCVPADELGGPELMCGKQYNDVYKIQISKKVKLLKLPEFTNWPPDSTNSLVKLLKAYCSEIHDSYIFPQIIRILDLPDEDDVRKHVEQVCWLNIVEIWAQCKIRHIFSDKEKSKQMLVMFDENELQRLLKAQWWIKLPLVTQFNK